jgi:hypothetical protein
MTMTPEALLTTAVTTLGAVVGTLAIWARSRFDSQESKLKDCEDDREKLWEKIAELTGAAGIRAMQCPKPDCPAKATFSLQRKPDA